LIDDYLGFTGVAVGLGLGSDLDVG